MSAHLTAHDLHLSFADHTVLAGVSITVAPSDRIGVIGPNGVGKSTLLSVLAGHRPPDRGRVTTHPGDAHVLLVPQELAAGSDDDVRTVLRRRTGATALQDEFDTATAALGAPDAGNDTAERYDRALARWLAGGAADIDDRIGRVLDEVGLGADRLDQPVSALSGGQRARVGLAGLLAATADVLLLDEPTNDLDRAGLDLLDRWVADTSGALVVVSHDRAFLERTVGAVFELDDHTRTGHRFNGGWRAYLDDRATRARHAEEAFGQYQDERRRLTERAQRQTEWASKGMGRLKKSAEPDRNIRGLVKESTEQQAAKAKQTRNALARLEVVDKPWVPWELRLELAEADRPGREVLSARDLVVERRRVGDDPFVLGPIDLDVHTGERVHLAGPNGAGKTTLLHALLGDVAPDAGVVHRGPAVVVGRLDQTRAALDDDRPLLVVAEELAGVGLQEIRTAFAKLGLDQRDVDRPARRLSPGERTRAMLGIFMLRPANTLVLDEPTNHLDLPAIEQLEQALAEFGGTVVLVTHDRAFLDAIDLDRRVTVDGGRVVEDTPLEGGRT